MIALPSIHAELAASIRRVNARYDQAGRPEHIRLTGPEWDRAETAVNTAMQSGERGPAMAAIESWERLCIDRIEEAVR